MEKSLVRRTRSTTWSTTSPQSSDPSSWWRTVHGSPSLVMVGCWPLGAKEIIVNICQHYFLEKKARYKSEMHVLFRCILCNTRKGDEQLEDQTWQRSDLRGNALQLKATAAGIAWGSHYKKCIRRHPSQASDQWHGDTHHGWTRCLDSMLNTARYKVTTIFASRRALLIVLFGTGEVEL